MLAVGSVGLSACTCLTLGQAEFDVGIKQRGHASWYGDYFHGLRTANGEIYDMHAMTAAHRTLEFGTRVKVTYLKTGKTVEVRINDRGPHVKDRIIDLSGAAARQLGLKDDGIGEVSVEVSR